MQPWVIVDLHVDDALTLNEIGLRLAKVSDVAVPAVVENRRRGVDIGLVGVVVRVPADLSPEEMKVTDGLIPFQRRCGVRDHDIDLLTSRIRQEVRGY